jgi:hypothetical protein
MYPDLTLEEYLAITDRDGWPAVSNTLLRSVRYGPRECQHRQRFGIKLTKSLLTGSLTHIQTLRPQDWLERVVVWDVPVYEPVPALQWEKISGTSYDSACGRYRIQKVDGLWQSWATLGTWAPEPAATVTAAKAACKAHYEEHNPPRPKLDADGNPRIAPQNPNSKAYQDFVVANPGREIVTPTDIEAAKRIAQAVRDNPEARRRLGQMWRTELTMVWLDPDTGVLCKCRHDWITDPRNEHLVTLGELKTCRSAEEGAFNRQAADMEYYGQAAHYLAGFRAHYDNSSPRRRRITTESVCLAVENGGCHDSTVFTWNDEHLEAGAKLNAERLQQLLEWRDDYGDELWPCRREAAYFDFEAHGRGHLLGEDDHGGLDLSGVERHGEED